MERMIVETVQPEYEALNKANALENDSLERCPCGSSLVRIVREEERDGHDYTAVCAKCNNRVMVYVNRLKEPPKELCKSCKHNHTNWDEEPCVSCNVTGASKYERE